MEVYDGRLHSKIGLNIALLIFPLSIASVYAQKLASIPLPSRIVVVKLILLALPNILGIAAIAFGFQGYREGDTAFGMFVLILAAISTIIMLWFTLWIFHDLSFLYKYGFLTPE